MILSPILPRVLGSISKAPLLNPLDPLPSPSLLRLQHGYTGRKTMRVTIVASFVVIGRTECFIEVMDSRARQVAFCRLFKEYFNVEIIILTPSICFNMTFIISHNYSSRVQRRGGGVPYVGIEIGRQGGVGIAWGGEGELFSNSNSTLTFLEIYEQQKQQFILQETA